MRIEEKKDERGYQEGRSRDWEARSEGLKN